ncbi:MAG: 3-oxoacyl-[acyl-carrier protein] reductase, partial [uncultured Solirubrobacterales bacterium]
GPPRHAGAPRRTDRQRRVRGRPGRLARIGDLLRGQGGGDRLHQDRSARGCALRGDRQRRRPRPDRDAAADGRARAARRDGGAAGAGHGGCDPARPPRPARRGRRGDRLSGLRRRLLRHRRDARGERRPGDGL